VEDRNAMGPARMKTGVTEAMERLEALLEWLKRQGEGRSARAA
jgi:hypothetical protein